MASIFFNFQKSFVFFEDKAFLILRPVLQVFRSIAVIIDKTFDGILTFKNAIKENEILKVKNQKLLSENVLLRMVFEENKSLRKILKISQISEKKMIMADAIGYNPINLGQYVVISKGAKAGVIKDLAVVDDNGFLVGKISEVYEQFSKVLLINDSSNLINVIVRNESSSQGIMRGEFGLAVILDMLPLEDKVEEGQEIVTVANGFLPGGILVGFVKKSLFKENDVFQRALIKPAVDFKKIQKVFIILPD